MTNLTRIFGTVLAAATMVAFAGCKKDETQIASFTITADTSHDFEYSQTKTVTYSSNLITTFEEPDAPLGWTCTRTAEAYVITSPSESAVLGKTAAASGTVTVSAVTGAGVTIKREITVAIKIAERITPQANCIIVSVPDKRYKFNARVRGNESAETLTAASGAYRAWTTSATAVKNVSFEDGYIYFATGGEASGDEATIEEANAVIAVINADGTVLWSWHIWATNYDPAAAPDIVAGSRVMNRNLGAFTNSDETGQDAWRSYGLYYQWGRKDPFVGPDAWDSSVQQPLYNHAGSYMTYVYEVTTEEKGTVEYATSRPIHFIAGAKESDFDWLYAARDNSLWSAASKSLYDPCPKGWRVAPPAIWASFTTTGTASTSPAEFNVDGGYNYGWRFKNGESAIYYPAAGRRNYSPTLATSARNFTNIVNDDKGAGHPVGFYWSASAGHTATAANAALLAFRHDYVNPDSSASPAANRGGAEGPRSGGFPLRCVAE